MGAYYGTSADSHPHGKTPLDLVSEYIGVGVDYFDPCPNNPDFDGLDIPWPRNIPIWCNPPYTRGLIGKWVKKCHEEWQHGSDVYLLIPSYTDTAYFHDFVIDCARIHFIRGRLKFGGYENHASFPSMVAVFK